MGAIGSNQLLNYLMAGLNDYCIWNGSEWTNTSTLSIPGTIYVSSNGDNTNDGRTPGFPVQDIQKACQLIEDSWAIVVLGTGTYDATGTIPSKCQLFAPNATLTGEITVGSCSVIVANRIIASASNTTIIKNLGCTGRTIIKANVISCSVSDTFTGSISLDIDIAYLSSSGYFVSPAEAGGPVNVLNEKVSISADFGASGTLTDTLETSPITSGVVWSTRLGMSGYLLFDYGRLVKVSEVLIATDRSDSGIGTFDVQVSNDPTFGSYSDKDHTYKDTTATEWVPYEYKMSTIATPELGRYMKFVWKTGTQSLQRNLSINGVKTISYEEEFGGEVNLNIKKVITKDNSTFIKTRSGDCNIIGNVGIITKNNRYAKW